jgi:transketolase
MLDRVIAATADRDVTVLYTATPHPLDAHALRGLMSAPDVVIAEPYLAGTSAAAISDALCDIPHRLLSIGVPNVEHRKYGTSAEHDSAYGIDTVGIRRKITEFAALRQVA